MTCNNYDKIVTNLLSATKDVAKQTMLDAVNAIKPEDSNDIVDVGVSVDGSWQKRGYSSHNPLL